MWFVGLTPATRKPIEGAGRAALFCLHLVTSNRFKAVVYVVCGLNTCNTKTNRRSRACCIVLFTFNHVKGCGVCGLRAQHLQHDN